MLRRPMLIVGIATLALCLTGVTGCKKKPGNKAGTGADMGAAMDPPPGTPVEMAPDAMDAVDAMDAMDAMEPDDDMSPDPTLPTKGQATARMILIGWKESTVPAEVKRTKAEAKTLADKALAEAKAKPGNEKHFTALVKKYADAFKDGGGKVGPFNPKEGMPYIVKAVFPLKVGGVSGIVETKAGFHIFMRTK
jgi:PPIC-type PPIASE domain